jgi:hypothetical protein
MLLSMKLRLSLVFFGLTALACAGSESVSDSGVEDNDDNPGVELSDASRRCDDTSWEFEADTSSGVAEVYVNIWIDEDELGDFYLTDRGSNNWFGLFTASEVGADCVLGGDHTTWWLVDDEGNTVEGTL